MLSNLCINDINPTMLVAGVLTNITAAMYFEVGMYVYALHNARKKKIHA